MDGRHALLTSSFIGRRGVVRACIISGQFIGTTDGGFEFTLAFVTALSFTELFVQRSLGIIGEREGRFPSDERCWFESHFLSLQISLQGIQKQPVMRYGEPTKR